MRGLWLRTGSATVRNCVRASRVKDCAIYMPEKPRPELMYNMAPEILTRKRALRKRAWRVREDTPF